VGGEGIGSGRQKPVLGQYLVGSNGVGKSTIAQNIAHQAVITGHTVLFTSAGQLLGDLAALDSDSALRRRLRHYTSPQLLVIDEVGYPRVRSRFMTTLAGLGSFARLIIGLGMAVGECRSFRKSYPTGRVRVKWLYLKLRS
jgi:hypothetical protein